MAASKKPAKMAAKPAPAEWGALPKISDAEAAAYDRKLRGDLAAEAGARHAAAERAAQRVAREQQAAHKAEAAKRAGKLGRIHLGKDQGMRSRKNWEKF